MRTVTFSEVNPQLLAQLGDAAAQPIGVTDKTKSAVLLPQAQEECLREAALERLFKAWQEVSDTAEANGLTEEILNDILAEIDAEQPR